MTNILSDCIKEGMALISKVSTVNMECAGKLKININKSKTRGSVKYLRLLLEPADEVQYPYATPINTS